MTKYFISSILLFLILSSCNNKPSAKQQIPTTELNGEKHDVEHNNESNIVYQSDKLIIKQLSQHVFVHTSFLKTNEFGLVPCNGMLFVHNNQALVIDSPTDQNNTQELLNFITDQLQCSLQAFVPSHSHIDCVGGIDVFIQNEVPIYASIQTKELLELKQIPTDAITSFSDSLSLNISGKMVQAHYLGQGHTSDNIVAYFPSEKVLFGGCLIKELGATKGNLADANLDEWPETVQKVKAKFADVKMVIPGHGKWDGTVLLDYTIKLFEYN